LELPPATTQGLDEKEFAMPLAIEVARTAYRVIVDYMGVKKGEKVLIVVDTRTSPSIPESLAAATLIAGGDPVIVMMAPRAKSGMEPPEPIAAAMVKADVIIAAASRSMYHIEAKNAAKKAGARGVFNAPYDEDGWANGAMTADFLEIRRQAERLRDRLARGKIARVTSPAGTDVTMTIEGRRPVGWLTGVCRNPGEVSAFPGGEVSLPPLEGSTEGRIVIEHIMTDIGRLSQPITWIVEGGNAVRFEGGAEALALEKHIEGVANATNIAELGIGLNPLSRLIGGITEVKKRLGTAHMALGDSAAGYGGAVSSDVHLDGMLLAPRIAIDGEIIVENGRVLV
jgi:leucyl aminopeptidase (aminopeptidase T)